MNPLFRLNRVRWYARIPIKCLLFLLTVVGVCYPYPHLLVRHVSRWRDPNTLVEPDAPALEPLAEGLAPRLGGELSAADRLKQVERFVLQQIPYEWDWNTWGVSDYLPTVEEVMEKGKEDCDGRAVIAASLLRRFGYKAELVSDFAHVWVKTDEGELMGPGKSQAIVAGEHGLALRSGWFVPLARALAYGIGPFPLVRELIVVGVFWLLLLGRGVGFWRGVVALGLLIDGLLFLKVGGTQYLKPIVWMQIVGAANMLGAVFLLLLVRTSSPKPGRTEAS